MADSLGSAVLTISVDDAAFKSGLNAAKAQAVSAADGISNSFRSLASVIGAVGLGVITQQIIETGKQSQKTKIQIDALTTAYGEQEQATASIARIQSILGISALQAREGYAKLFGALRGAGIGAAQVEVLFVGLTKAALASGAGTQEASASLIQLKQGLASGRLAGDELRSVLENLPVLTQAIASQLGTTVGQVKQLGAEGKITSDIVFEAAKQVASEEVRARTEAENLGRAYENLKEQIAAAIGPGVKTVLAGIAAGFSVFAKLVEDNASKIKGFVVATLALGRALAPFAAAILTVRAAMIAYQVAAKAAAVAQAAVLALSGPAGWATLATGLTLAAGAAYGIEQAMRGVQSETGKAKEEYEKYRKEFEQVLNNTNLDPANDPLRQQEELNQLEKKLAAQKKAENEILAPAKERLATLQATIGLQGVALEFAEQQLAVDKARSERAKAILDYDNALAATGFNVDDASVIEAAARLEAAGLNIKSALLESAQKSADIINRTIDQVRSATNGFNSTIRSSFDFFSRGFQEEQIRRARASIQPLIDRGVFRQGIDISTPERLFQLANVAESFNNAEKELVAAQKENTIALNKLAEVDWRVNVQVNADGTYQAYGDVVNNAVGVAL